LFLFPLFNNPVQAVQWYKYPENPVLERGTPESWDSGGAISTSVLYDGANYKMWYSTSQGSPGKIGYASSPDGINWTKSSSNPIIVPDNTIDGEIDVMDPYVILDEGVYKMWYTSVRPYTGSGNEVYRIAYTSTTDPTNWPPGQLVLRAVPSSWESEGPAQPSVVKIGSTFKLWYAARDSVGKWQIGYADSTDGTAWNKNVNNPILTASQPWEYSHIAGPRGILIDGSVYNLWYHAGPVVPYNIDFAYSNNGTSDWVKPLTENPAIERGPVGSFDQTYLANPFVLKDGAVYKMWYSGFNGSSWAIGYATSPQIPTPPPTNKVVVIPGATASWNPDALLNCKADDYEGDWTLIDQAHGVYDPTMQALADAGWSPTLYPYDWRKRIPENEPALKAFIDNQLTTGEKVHIVGHSMGGLLGRSYLEQEQNSNRVEKLLTVGSPHEGAVLSYPTWSAGKIMHGDPIWKFMLTLAIKRCSQKNNLNDREAVQQYFKSSRNILPVFDYLIDDATGLPKPVQYATNDWLSSSFTSPFWNTTVGTLRGTGQQTEQTYRVKLANKHDQNLGNWADGKPVQTIKSSEGDGTVLLSSANVPGADNTRVLAETHTGLISTAQGTGKILDFLGTAPQTIQSVTANIQTSLAAETGLFVVGYPANFWIVGPDGKLKKDTNGLTSFANPVSGVYKLLLAPKQDNTLVIVAQVLPNDKILWKEYKFSSLLPKYKTIRFNAENPIEDALN